MNFLFSLPLILMVSTNIAFASSGKEDVPMKPIDEVFEPEDQQNPSTHWKVAVVQWNPSENKLKGITATQGAAKLQKNAKEMAVFAEEAAKNGAKFVVFSEFAMTGYPFSNELKNPETENYESPDQVVPYAETIPGASSKYFGAMAKRLGIWLQYGIAEKAKGPGGKIIIHNSAVLINDQGEIVGTHRKQSLFEVETEYVTPGSKVTAYDSPIGKIGMLICADVYLYSILGQYVNQGVTVLTLSTSWAEMNTGMKFFAQAAVHNKAYLLAANQNYYPDSGVINPNGKLQSHIRQSSDSIAYGYIPLAKASKK